MSKFIVKKECDWTTFSAKPGAVLDNPKLPKEVIDHLLAEKAIAVLDDKVEMVAAPTIAGPSEPTIQS